MRYEVKDRKVYTMSRGNYTLAVIYTESTDRWEAWLKGDVVASSKFLIRVFEHLEGEGWEIPSTMGEYIRDRERLESA